MIKEDAVDSELTKEELDEQGSKMPVVNPQISITDTHGQVTNVTEPAADEMATDELELMGGGCASTASSEHSLVDSTYSPLSPHSPRSPHSVSPHVSPQMSPQSQHYPRALGYPYPGLNLASLPCQDTMDVDLDSPIQNPYAGIYSHGFSRQFNSLVDTQNLLVNQQSLRLHERLGSSSSLGVPKAAAMGSAGSSPDFDSHHSPVISPNYSSYSPSPTGSVHNAEEAAVLDNINALNLHKGLAEVQPNICVAVPLSVSSKRTMSDLLQRIKVTLDDRRPQLLYEHTDNRFRLAHSGVQLEMEVCQGIAERGVRIRKLAGDPFQYNCLCSELLTCLNLWE